MPTATCSLCDWGIVTTLSEQGAKMLAVMHALKRHPAEYAHATGRDPREAEDEYREILADPEIQGVI